MPGIRFIVGRPRGEKSNALQSIQFDAREWPERDAREWLQRKGYEPRNIGKAGGWFRYQVRDKSVFIPRTLRTVDTERRECVTMASNPKRKQRRGKVKKVKNKNPKTRAKRARKPAKARPAKAKTTRTKVTSVKVVRANPRKRRRRAPAPARRSSARHTVAFANTRAAAVLAQGARLSVARRREMLRSLRAHPSGGVFVTAPSWHGSLEQAKRLAERVRSILVYAAGRRRQSLTAASVPRVVAVP